MLKLMVSRPASPLASKIACLSDPAPLSFVFVTVNAASSPFQPANSSAAPKTAVSIAPAANSNCQSPPWFVLPVSSMLAATSAPVSPATAAINCCPRESAARSQP